MDDLSQLNLPVKVVDEQTQKNRPVDEVVLKKLNKFM